MRELVPHLETRSTLVQQLSAQASTGGASEKKQSMTLGMRLGKQK